MIVDEFISHIQCTRGHVDPEIIEDLEYEIDGGLPPDYRQFLCRCNGGYVNGRLQLDSNTSRGTVHIDAVGGDEAGLCLTNYREIYWGRIPDELLWIMGDPFGNSFLLGVSGQARGKIYYWHAEAELDQVAGTPLQGRTDLFLLADSFTEFLAGVRSGQPA